MSVEVHTDFELDESFELLKSERRRIVIEYLDEHPVADFDELVDGVDDAEPDTERKTAYVALYQTHVPKLDDEGVVDWDRDGGTVTRGARFSTLVDTLHRATGPSGFLSRLLDAL